MARPTTLETDRLRLRPLAAADAEALHALWTTPGGRQYLWDGEVIPREQTEDVIRRSWRVMEKLGMRFKRRATIDGLDTIFYTISR